MSDSLSSREDMSRPLIKARKHSLRADVTTLKILEQMRNRPKRIKPYKRAKRAQADLWIRDYTD